MVSQGLSNFRGCLEGIKVIDLSRLYPGPFCTMILADNGAEVICVEDKRYKNELFIQDLYRNKKHVNIDLKKTKGKEAFLKLAKDADVIVEGFRPGVTDKLGIGYKDISKINPRIIYCSLSGYGQNGPFNMRAGHDVNYLSYAGILDLIGPADGPPTIPGIQIADVAGALYGVIGIVMALYAREKSGEGQYIDISLADSAFSFSTLVFFFMKLQQTPPRRSNTFLSHRYACYNTYETKDGRAIGLGAVENRFWEKICKFFNREDYIPLQYDEKKREEIIGFFREKFKQKTLEEWKKELQDVDCCWSEVLHFEEALELPLFKEREMIISVKDDKGKDNRLIGSPLKFSKNPTKVKSSPTSFGKDTEEILTRLGYSKEEFEEIV